MFKVGDAIKSGCVLWIMIIPMERLQLLERV